ncbi:DUF748 domain-containing protein [Shewanella psychropiezotolerans]|uniref:DUF748 domain-containing protein n=1 Tax=Shewanella psychropiezotolerans TaxID=2593655 RepID=A0ABX5WXF1_9GAMM|nr:MULTISPECIES: DUF748 domain-containing protein [Shewanella]MPY26565.1 DUF748 domain-containing protein [Shewanella sp. YLB-07]QDO83772.1 DUF748 domain-containing protein [Shewanella psychropiezotolerans]
MSKPFTQLAVKFRHLPKYQRYLAILLTIYLIFTAVLGLLVPYVAHKQLPQELSAVLKRPVMLEDVSINPLTLKVSLTGFSVQEKDKSNFIGFGKLTFQLDFWRSIINAALSVDHVTLDKPYALLERLNKPDSFTFNFSDIIQELANSGVNETDIDQPETPSGLPHIKVKDLSILDAELLYTDKVTDSRLHYPAMTLHLKAFDTLKSFDSNGNGSNQFSIRFVGKDGGEIATQGKLQLSPLNIIGELQLTAIQLPQFWSFIADDVQARLDSGQFSFNTHFEVLAQADLALQLLTQDGQFSLENISFVDDQSPLLSLPLLSLNGISLNLADKQVKIASVETEKLSLNASLTTEGLDILPLFMPVNSGEKRSPKSSQSYVQEKTGQDSEDKQAALDWSAIITSVAVKDYDLNLVDNRLTDNTPWRIFPFNLSTGEIRSNLESPIEFRLDLAINNRGTLQSSGSVDAKQETLKADIALSKFDLSQIQAYLQPYINIDLKQGELNTKGSLTAGSDKAIYFSGDIKVDELLVKDNLHKKTLVKWQSMSVNRLILDQGKNKLSIESVDFTKPYGRIIIAEDKSTNIQALLVKSSSEQSANIPNKPASESQAPLEINIGQIRFNQGSTFFADNSLTPNFAASIEQLEGSIDKLSSTAKRPASVDIKGKIDKYAPVTLKGDLNPLLEMPYLDLALNFSNVELTSVNPYSGTYAGYYIDKGQMSLSLNYQLENNKLKGSNHLVVDQLKLGKPSDSSLATTLPVTLAIALLQDRHGVIDLGLDVSGDLDSPSFSFGSIIMTAFTNVITKAVTAPFSLLAGLFGDDEQLDKIAFEPGQTQISADEQEKLAILAKALLDRPKLTLSIEGAIDAVTDARILKEQILRQKLANLSQTEIESLPSDLSASNFPTEGSLSDALISLYKNETGLSASELKLSIEKEHTKEAELDQEKLQTLWHIALYNFSLNKQVVDDDMLGTLASSRASAVKTHLVEINKIPPSRIFLLDSRIDINHGAQEALLTLGAD